MLINFTAGNQSFDYGDSEVDSLSTDLEKGLNLQEEIESDCITNDTSFTEYDYLNERGTNDGGEEATEWDEEGVPFEEELTDLDTDDDLPMSEQDMEDSLENCSVSKQQPLRTCVQQELTLHHQQRFNEVFLQVKGAGLTVPERERFISTTDGQNRSIGAGDGNIGCGVDTENGLDLIAEVERRRLRDFGLLAIESGNQENEGSVPGKGECNYGTNARRDRSKSVPCATNIKLSNSDQRPSLARSGATAGRTYGETSAEGDVSAAMGVSTPRGSDQPSPALTPSLFPGYLPPTIHFPMPYENCEWYVYAALCVYCV